MRASATAPAPVESPSTAAPPSPAPASLSPGGGDLVDLGDLPEPQGDRYDPAAIARRYRGRWWVTAGRLLQILLPCLGLALRILWDRQRGKLERNEGRRAGELREILTRLGPAYIKIGQALSTRPDLVPPTYLEELTHLQDQLPPFSNDIAFHFIEEELGAPPEELFADLSDRPLAAASLGQVYKGRLKTGETVAVKVQRPGLTDQIALDLYVLRQLASWAQRNVKRIRSDLVAIADEFASRIYEEMDYTQEGHNAERFARLYGHLPHIYVPKIYWDYTGTRVLTMEWIAGTKLTKLDAIAEQGIDASYLVEVGVQCSLRQLLEHGFFHADPHPGNLLATPDGNLAYLDFGMMSEVKPYQRYGLIEAVVHMVNRDFEGLAQDYVNLEFLTPETDLTPIIPALREVFSNALGASVAELNFKSITDEFSALMYEYPFRVPAYYALIIRSLVTLEGIAINVDPNFKVLSKAYPYIAKRLLTDPSPQLRSSLQALLFKDGSFRWNRLENLLRNARDSSDYDFDRALDRAVDYLFSERGKFIREQIVTQLVELIDTSGQNAFRTFLETWGERLGWSPERLRSGGAAPASAERARDRQETLQRLQNIWRILQETPGFDTFQLVQLLARAIAKPETQQMGQQIAGELTQRAIARFIREALLAQGTPRSANPAGEPLPVPAAAWRS